LTQTLSPYTLLLRGLQHGSSATWSGFLPVPNLSSVQGFDCVQQKMRKANRAPSIITNWKKQCQFEFSHAINTKALPRGRIDEFGILQLPKKQCQFEFSHAINTSASTILFVGSKRNANFMKMNTRKTFCGRSFFYENIKTVCDRKQQITVVYVDNATRVKKIQ